MPKISRLNFAHLPTPVEAMNRLSEELGGPKLLIKRDDQTGLATGGNKARKGARMQSVRSVGRSRYL